MTDELSRRDFLRVTAGAGALAALTSPFAQASGAPTSQPPAVGAGWFDRPMRWVQLTLVENDPGRFDPDVWLEYYRRLHADAATRS